jgi:hypothetical protein
MIRVNGILTAATTASQAFPKSYIAPILAGVIIGSARAVLIDLYKFFRQEPNTPQLLKPGWHVPSVLSPLFA